MKTYSAKPADVTQAWYVIDASEAPLGRIATKAATLLTGKGKPMFTAHIDCGDNVIIINAAKLVVTGSKLDDKMYYRHSGYPGGLAEASLKDVIAKDASRAVFEAIRGMLPANKLRDPRLLRLKIYLDDQHKHEAQKPETLSMKKGTK